MIFNLKRDFILFFTLNADWFTQQNTFEHKKTELEYVLTNTVPLSVIKKVKCYAFPKLLKCNL